MDKKELTEKQKAFLVALFGEAEGNPREAMRIAQYSEYTTTAEVVEALKEEILNHTNSFLAAHAPKASMKLIKALDESAPHANVLRAIQMVLNRAGIKDKAPTGEDINLKIPSGGLFILPAKELQEFKRVDAESE